MTSTGIFQRLDVELLDAEISTWNDVHQALSQSRADVAERVDQIKGTWQSAASKRFFEWWWGSADNPNAGLGAKADLETLEKMIEVVVATLTRFSGFADDINGPLYTATQIIDDNAFAPNRWRAWVVSPRDRTKHNGSVVYGNPSGTLHAQKIVDGRKCYITFFPLEPNGPFPYGENTLAGDGNIIETPGWYVDANEAAHRAAEVYVTACQDSIKSLQTMLKKLPPDIHKLTPYTRQTPYVDPTWQALTGTKRITTPSGMKKEYAWVLKNRDLVLGGEPNEPGGLPSGADPLFPAAPGWYFGPSTASVVFGYFVSYGIPALSVLLATTGLGEIAGLVDGIFDSAGFLEGLSDLAASGAVPGLSVVKGVSTALDGYEILVDADQVDGVAEYLAKQLVGSDVPEGYTEAANQLVSKVKEQLIKKIKTASTKRKGADGKKRYVIDPSTLLSEAKEAGAIIGDLTILKPIANNPNLFGT